MADCGDRGLWARDGVQGIDGGRTAAGPAVRQDLRVRRRGRGLSNAATAVHRARPHVDRPRVSQRPKPSIGVSGIRRRDRSVDVPDEPDSDDRPVPAAHLLARGPRDQLRSSGAADAAAGPAATVAVVALLLLTLVALLRWPLAGFLGAWVWLTLAPTSSIVPIATEVGAERRMYLPLIALVAGTVFAAHKLFAVARVPARVRAAILVVTTAALSATTLARNQEYGSALTLARTTLARWPSAVAHGMVGAELAALGRDEEALPELRAGCCRRSPRPVQPRDHAVQPEGLRRRYS